MTDVTKGRTVSVPRLGWVPSPWFPIFLLAAGFAGEVVVRAEAAKAAAVEKEAAKRAEMAAARARDSSELAVRVDSLRGAASRSALMQLDSVVHSRSYELAHDALHARAVRARLDSAGRLLRKAATSVQLHSATRLLAGVSDPRLPGQVAELARLRAQADRLQRAQAEASQRAEVAETKRKAAAAAQEQQRRNARPSHPAGATAICRDGSYSYSANRRGTCSRHGGVSQWL